MRLWPSGGSEPTSLTTTGSDPTNSTPRSGGGFFFAFDAEPRLITCSVQPVSRGFTVLAYVMRSLCDIVHWISA